MAGDRRRALVRGSLGVVAAMQLLGVGLALLRLTYVNETPADVLTEAAAGQVFDTLVAFLPDRAARRRRARSAGRARRVPQRRLVGGHSHPGGVRARHRLLAWRRRVGRLGQRRRRGVDLRPQARAPLGVFLAAGLLLVFWTRPTGWVVAWTAMAVVLALVVVEFLGRPPRQPVGLREGDDGETSTATLPTVPRQVPRGPSEDVAGEPVAGDSSRRTTETQTPAP